MVLRVSTFFEIMGLLSRVTFFACLLFGSAPALSTKERYACQAPTRDPREGCPQGTLLVNSTYDASSKSSKSYGSSATFSTIQSAILSLPHDNSAQSILILPGHYTEQLNITRSGPLYLLGQTNSPSDLRNTVEVIWHQATGNANSSIDNAYTSTLTVAPTLNSSLTGTYGKGDF